MELLENLKGGIHCTGGAIRSLTWVGLTLILAFSTICPVLLGQIGKEQLDKDGVTSKSVNPTQDRDLMAHPAVKFHPSRANIASEH